MGTNDSNQPGKINLLFVDDEQQFLESMSTRLRLRGFNVIAVDRGEKALEAARGQNIDVALVDLKMPGIDGLEVLRKVKATRPEIEVIILTGHGSEKEEEEARRLGAFEYLQKPADTSELLGTVRSAWARGPTQRS